MDAPCLAEGVQSITHALCLGGKAGVVGRPSVGAAVRRLRGPALWPSPEGAASFCIGAPRSPLAPSRPRPGLRFWNGMVEQHG